MQTLVYLPDWLPTLSPVPQHLLVYRVHDMYEVSAPLREPGIAKLAVPPEGTVHFIPHPVDDEVLLPYLTAAQTTGPEFSFILDLQRAGAILLRKGKRPIAQRLILLGLFLEDAADYIATERGYQIGKLMQDYASPRFTARFDEALSSLSFSPVAYLEILGGLLQKLADSGLLESESGGISYVHLISQLFGLDGSKDATAQERTYRDAKRAMEANVENLWPELLPNLLRYVYFCRFYPCSVPGGITHNYWVFVLYYKLFELSLLALSLARRERLKLEDVYALMQHLSRRRDASGGRYTAVIEQYIRAREEDSLALFSALYDWKQ